VAPPTFARRASEDNAMLDLLLVVIVVGFFAGCFAYVAGCERL
jgi:hypothetical protein